MAWGVAPGHWAKMQSYHVQEELQIPFHWHRKQMNKESNKTPSRMAVCKLWWHQCFFRGHARWKAVKRPGQDSNLDTWTHAFTREKEFLMKLVIRAKIQKNRNHVSQKPPEAGIYFLKWPKLSLGCQWIPTRPSVRKGPATIHFLIRALSCLTL